MSERARPERGWFDRLAVVLRSTVIFATIPLARTIQGAVRAAWGEDAFLYAVLVVILATGAVAFRYLHGLAGVPSENERLAPIRLSSKPWWRSRC